MAHFTSMWELLKKYQFHLESELYGDVACTICKKILIDAHQGSCGCNFCKLCIENYLRDGNQFCPGNTKECKLYSLSLENNIVKDNGANRKVAKLKLKCPFLSCEHICELSELPDHLKDCKYQFLCPYSNIGCKLLVKSNESIPNHLQNCIYEHNKLVIKCLDKIRNETSNQMQKLIDNECKKNCNNEISNLKKLCSEIIKENSVLKSEVESLQDSVGKTKRLFEKRESVISNTSQRSNKSRNNFQKMSVTSLPEDFDLEDHLASIRWDVGKLFQGKQKRENILSEYFYSIDKIYEMRLRLCLSDSCSNGGDYLSVKFYIHKGVKDMETFLPFKGNINVSIINKMHPEDRKMKTKYREIKGSDLNNDNIESFNFTYSELRQLRVLENDPVIIECNVQSEEMDNL